MTTKRHPAWIRRISAALVVPFTLLALDAPKIAWAYKTDHARRQKLVDVAHKQGIDPDILLDPIGYQKKEAERAKVRREKAVKEAEALSRPDPVALAAAEKERAQVKKAYAPVELASIAKDIEGLRTTLGQLRAAAGDHRRTESTLNSVDGYARILSDAHEVLARYDATERERLAGLPAVIRARHNQFMREATPLVRGLRDGLDDLVKTGATRRPTAITGIETKLARIAPAPSRPMPTGFAMHAAKFEPATPRHAPEQILRMAPQAISPQKFDAAQELLRNRAGGVMSGIFKLPSFLTALLSGPGAGDLSGTDEAPLSDEIRAKAAALGNDPIQMFNFVHDSVVTEVYYGSKKGARGTLAEMAGNDFDQASLLIALLRAAGFPARYEMGTVVLTPEQAMGFTGTETPAAAASALVSSGFPAQQQATGNTVTGVQMELVWVRAYVPYQNYRGIGVAPGGQGAIWGHLAPSIKRYQSVSAVDLVGKVPFDFEAYLSKEQPKSPVETWEDQVRAYIQANPALNCTTLEGAQKARLPIADRLPLLPETLPVQVAQRLAVFTDVPTAFKHTLEIVGASSGGAAEVDYSASVAALYGKPLSVQYEPATAADAATLNAHGGLENTPAYLIQLKPILYTADQALATGSIGDTPGLNQSWQVRLTIPQLGAEQPLSHTFAVGGVYALVNDPGTMPGALVDAAAQLEQDFTTTARPADFITAARLVTLGRRYFSSFDRGRDRVTGLYQTRHFKDTYEGSFGISVQNQTVNGLPVSVKRNLVDLDVTRLTTTPFAINGANANSPAVTRLIGHNSSFLEHSTPQAFFGSNQWSSLRLLGNAAQTGQTIFHIDGTNVDAVLSRIAVPDAIASDIRDQVIRGRTVRIHSLAITPPRLPALWGYILEDPNTGEGGYRVNATLNGGVGDISPEEEEALRNCPKCLAALRKISSEVEVSDGTYSFDENDLTIPAIGSVASLFRTYRSSNHNRRTALGPGWQHLYDAQLVQAPDGTITFFDQLGHPSVFSPLGGGAFQSDPGYDASLLRGPDGSYSLTLAAGTVFSFDSAGFLSRQQDTNGNVLQITRDAAGRTVLISDRSARALLTFEYDARGLLSHVGDLGGRSVGFEYDLDGRLEAVTDVLGNRKSYGYDRDGRLISKSDFRGNTWSISYDSAGRWRSVKDPIGSSSFATYAPVSHSATVTDPNGVSTTFHYDVSGARTQTIDALGNTTTYAYDAELRPVQVSLPGGATVSTRYDGGANALHRTDEAGHQTTYEYGPFGRVAAVTDPIGQRVSNQYDVLGNLISTTDAEGRTTKYSYQPGGLLASVTTPDGGSSSLTYDSSGKVIGIRDPDGNTTAFSYNAIGQPTGVTEPNGARWLLEVDARGRIIADTDPTGRRTVYSYDADGNRISVTDPSGKTTLYTYDPLSRPILIVDGQGNSTKSEYDANGNVTARIASDGARVSYSYDALGRLVSTTDPYGATQVLAYCADHAASPCRRIDAMGNVLAHQYDSEGHLLSTTDALGRITRFEVDALGRRTTITDPAGNSRLLRYDSRGRVVESQDALGHSIAYAYNSRGQKTSVIDENNQQTTFTYSLAGRLLSSTNPLGGTTSYAYDSVGNLVSKQESDGHTTIYKYDVGRRLLSRASDDGKEATFEYDALGRLGRSANEDTSQTFTYDDFDRIRTVVDGRLNKTLTYDYDAVGNRKRLTDSDGTQTTYTWDLSRRLREVVDAEGEMTRFEYDPLGRRTVTSYANGLQARYQYDAASQVTNIAWTGNTTLESFSYSYGSSGEMTSKSFADGTAEVYGYDATGKLISTSYPDGRVVQYGYDAAGNRTRETRSGAVSEEIQYKYNGLNQLVATTGGGEGGSTFAYDARGNQIERASGADTTRYSYDVQNRLREVDFGRAPATKFFYDPDGLRIATSGSSGQHGTLWDGHSEYADFDEVTGKRLAQYDRDITRPDALLAQVTSDGKHRFVSDALGSVYGLVDSRAKLASSYRYDVFGSRSVVNETVPTQWGFTGRPIVANDLQYHRARFLQTDLGRWNRLDPAGFVDGPNQYGYVRSNPATAIDPSGQFYWFLFALEIAAFASEVTFILFAGAGALLAVAFIAYLVALTADSTGVEGLSTSAMNTANAGYEAFTAVLTLGLIASTLATLGPGGGSGGAPAPTMCRAQADRIMQDTADDAAGMVGSSGANASVRGTYIHTVAEGLIKTLPEDVELTPEVSYLNYNVVPRGTPGSVRVDAVYGPVEEPYVTYDIKTGKAGLTPARVTELARHVPGSPPAAEVRPWASGPQEVAPK